MNKKKSCPAAGFKILYEDYQTHHHPFLPVSAKTILIT
jgi:hypothetical protein